MIVPLICLTNSTVEYPYVRTNGGIWFEPYTAGLIASRLMEWEILTNEVVIYQKIVTLGNSNISNMALILDNYNKTCVLKSVAFSNAVTAASISGAGAFVISTILWLSILVRR